MRAHIQLNFAPFLFALCRHRLQMTKLLNKMLELTSKPTAVSTSTNTAGQRSSSSSPSPLLLHAPGVVDSADAHGNTLLSEAAAGGAVRCVGLLIQVGGGGGLLRRGLTRGRGHAGLVGAPGG